MSQIIVLAEHSEGTFVKASLNAVAAAKQLAEKVGGGFDIALVGNGIGNIAQSLAGYGANTVYQVEDSAFEGYTAQAYAQGFHKAIEASGAQFVVVASTAKGKDCTPRVAARLDAGMASDVIGIDRKSVV